MIKATNTEDREMLIGIQQADGVVIEQIYRRYLPGIIRFVERNNGTEADARDIFQEAVLVVYKKCLSGDFELTAPLETFLFAVCRNRWRTILRKATLTTSGPLDAREDPDQDTLQLMERAAKEQVYYNHFKRLGAKCRLILELFFQKTPMKEIARAIGSSESYVKKRKHICKERLTQAIKNDPRYKELIS